ncbi:MAG: hypothetical protein HY321_14135 [Armatimonadetes bacterium]|nr:hypothetical protein [Armatimonadota bacterium]
MTSSAAAERAREFLSKASRFRLGDLLTETPHPGTSRLSQAARECIPAALAQLFEVDRDVVETYRRWIATDAPARIRDEVVGALRAGGRLFFTGCGATGRLSIQMESIWRDFWQQRRAALATTATPHSHTPTPPDWEDRTFSVMAGGDFALIKSVEGFEDYAEFGRRQIRDQGVRAGDVVFAITEGGETSFVIGTAREALDSGARVFFVYNNPDDVLRATVARSRRVLDEPRIEKVNLTTGPMAITGSTRMQATSIQLCAMLTLMEMVLRELQTADCRLQIAGGNLQSAICSLQSDAVPAEFLRGLETIHATLASKEVRRQVAQWVALEEGVYRARRRNTYFAGRLGVDVLTDTTERSPTFCTPTFRKFDDAQAAESWSFLFLPRERTPDAWEYLLKRPLRPVAWDLETVREMAGDAEAPRLHATVQSIGREEILRFRIGTDGLPYRASGPGDSAACIVTEEEMAELLAPDGFYRARLEEAHAAGAATALLFLGGPAAIAEVRAFLHTWHVPCLPVLVPLPETEQLLGGPLRVGAKMLLNTLSTCTMVRLGRVMGNVMIWVVPSNLKLIDRATRYVQALTGLAYEDACLRLFEAVEYVAPRAQAGWEYPAVVGLAVTRARHGGSFVEAETRLYQELGIEAPAGG